MGKYESYEDWYDHGPGSESFERSCRVEHNDINFSVCGNIINHKKIKTKKNGKNVIELLDSLNKHLKEDHKLSPFVHIPKGLLEEIVREGRRLHRYVEELESD